MRNLRQGSGFGVVVLLLVVAVVMMLAGKMLRGVGGAAIEVTKPGAPTAASKDVPPPSANTGAGQARIQASATEMQRKTAAHTAAVNDALKDPQ